MKAFLILIAFCFALHTAKAQEWVLPDSIRITEHAPDKWYGVKKKTSIKVGSIDNEYAYIAQLISPYGEEVSAVRLGSCCSFKVPDSPFGEGLLDMWEIKYLGLKEPILLYLNAYEYAKPMCPTGLSFSGN